MLIKNVQWWSIRRAALPEYFRPYRESRLRDCDQDCPEVSIQLFIYPLKS